MSQSPVARRYASALLQQADADGVTDRVDADVDLLRQAIADSRDFALLLRSPVVSRERKLAALRALLESRVQPVTLRFLGLMVDKRREGLFGEVIDAYRALRDARLGLVQAHVRTARALDAADERAVADRLSRLTGRKVRLAVTLDPSLVGGMVVRVGDTVYDGSVANRLASLRERLMHGQAIN